MRRWDWPGSGPRVLFLHGFLDTGRSFERVVEALDGRVRASALDWRGHGGSRPVPEGMSFHQLDHLKDLLQALDAQADDRPDLVVAHSLGATIGFLHAAARPGAVPAWLFLDGCGGFPSTAEDQAEALSRLLEAESRPKRDFRSFPDEDAAAARVCENNRGLSEGGARVMVRGATEPAPDGGVRFAFDARLRGPNPFRWTEGAWRAMAGRIRARVHVLIAENGVVQRVPGFAERVECIPRGSWERLPGSYHHLHLDAAPQVADAVRRMLGQDAARR